MMEIEGLCLDIGYERERRGKAKGSRMVQRDTIQETRPSALRRRARRTRLAGLLTAMVVD